MWRRAEAALGERRLSALAALAIAAALVIAFWPLLAGRLFVYANLGNGFLPLRLFFAERLERGESALWMPHLFCGFFAHGEGQLGAYHPLALAGGVPALAAVRRRWRPGVRLDPAGA